MVAASVALSLFIAILVIGLIAGIVVFLIRRAPFIDEPFKSWAVYAVMAIAVLVILLKALPLLGVAV